MYFGRKQEFDWPFAMVASDLLALFCAFWMETVFQSSHFNPLIHPGVSLDWHKCLLFAVIILYVLQSGGLYRRRILRRRHGTPHLIAIVAIVAGIGFVIVQEIFLGPITVGERKSLEWIVLFSAILIWVFRILFRFLVMDVFHLIPEERIIFIGWSSRIERALKGFSANMGRFQKVLGFVHEGEDPTWEMPFEKGFRPLGPASEMDKILLREEATLVLVDEGGLDSTEIHRLSEVCSRCLVDFKIILSSFDILAGKMSLRIVGGVPLLGVYNLPFFQYRNRVLKRAVDIVGSIVGLILSAPIMAICVLLIKRESPGPAFYSQPRTGWRGRPFQIHKLRSMRLDSNTAETGPSRTMKDDPRRLKIGAFLRKWNLDEVPQFWNVLKGDMSLVGPRPEQCEFAENFRQTIRHYHLRHSCRPGMTGWAAVNGLRGETSFVDRLEYDLFYIENWSLLLDFKIMLRTFFPSKNAY